MMGESEVIVQDVERQGIVGVRQALKIDKPLAEFTSREIGTAGEALACSFLERRGMEVVERNWRCPFGEVDIVCRPTVGDIVLVEVKTRLVRGALGDSSPEVAVGTSKQRRYGNLALCYINEHPRVDSVRFDVVAVTLSEAAGARMHHISSAFYWDE